ncbi:MAG: NAD(P)-binding protein [Lachnospiraceae bacterium]|nr:NAD(P)-binding protein [Lachnospiraceae bacterium]
MLRIQQLKLSIHHSKEELLEKAAKLLSVRKEDITEFYTVRRSLDARKKEDIHYSYVCEAVLRSPALEEKVLRRVKPQVAVRAERIRYSHTPTGTKELKHRPVIVGAGPAGLFCAYRLALAGYAPILLERGAGIEERVEAVERFWKEGTLLPDTNVQFGEGGAGTFSDGKLNTMVKETSGRIRLVLETFVKFGAPEDILYNNKPHIGTDCLRGVIINLRKELLRLGCEVRFHAKVTDIVTEDGQVRGVYVGEEFLPCEVLVLAVGHSARDTFSMLKAHSVPMTKKAFAVGVRIEHEQEMINRAQYKDAAEVLPAADYKLTHTAANGRGIYSFCMCPGGFVVNASSEPGCLTVNGMSNRARDERNANSALVVTVTPEDFGGDAEDVLAGVEFQRRLERAAYRAGGGKIPVQLYGDLLNHKPSVTIGHIVPNTKGAYALTSLEECLPDFVTEALLDGIAAFDRKIKGFASEEAVLLGVEARTSSPVRIERNDELMSSLFGLYPCGEGAGYAGGITSAAVDGIRVYEKIAERYRAAVF